MFFVKIFKTPAQLEFEECTILNEKKQKCATFNKFVFTKTELGQNYPLKIIVEKKPPCCEI